uniref:Uncharacterized protein n=1 Tax=Siphoviridae sp. ct9zP9 TaxID=2827795 RepID=A0A8S5SGV2_9CAUD|nr:MAG TPA: hypothetical protein [Siphoviridae sp. ct9zP9]
MQKVAYVLGNCTDTKKDFSENVNFKVVLRFTQKS